MRPLEHIPAMRHLDTDRANLFAAEIVGRVTGADFENLCGLLEGAYAQHDKIDLLLIFADHEGVDWDELNPTTITEARGEAGRHVRRCALIGRALATHAFAGVFGLSPVETRFFSDEEAGEAWKWLGATRKPEEV